MLLFSENLAIQGVAKLKLKQYATLSREEQYESGLQKGAYAITMVKKLGLKSPAERMLFTEYDIRHFMILFWLCCNFVFILYVILQLKDHVYTKVCFVCVCA